MTQRGSRSGVATILAITMAALGAPTSAQSPLPGQAVSAEPFPIYGLGRVGYALATWQRAPWNGDFAFIVPGSDIDAADYSIVVPETGRSLEDRVSDEVEHLLNDMGHASEPTVETLQTPSGAVGRVIRHVTGVPTGIEGYYLFATCTDGTALEARFMQPTTSDDEAAAAMAIWDDLVAKVVPCHADVRVVGTGQPVTGDAARLGVLLRDWVKRQTAQWAAFRELVTHGGKDLGRYVARADAIRDAVARIDRDERAQLVAMFPEPFSLPVMVVATATAGLDVPAMLDRLGKPRTRADVEAMEAAAETGFALWVGGMQEAFRSLGFGDLFPFPR